MTNADNENNHKSHKMSTKNTIPIVIIPAASHMQPPSSSSQQPTLQHRNLIEQQKPTSTPPFPPMREQQDIYDPSNNWQVNRKRSYSFQNPQQSSHAEKIKKNGKHR